MRLNRMLLLFAALLLVPAIAQAECQDDLAFLDAPVAAADELPPLEQIFVAAGSKEVSQSKSTMNGTGKENGLLACEWFVISCSGGGGDVCCGSVNSCLVYCVDLCGGPCVYQE